MAIEHSHLKTKALIAGVYDVNKDFGKPVLVIQGDNDCTIKLNGGDAFDLKNLTWEAYTPLGGEFEIVTGNAVIIY